MLGGVSSSTAWRLYTTQRDFIYTVSVILIIFTEDLISLYEKETRMIIVSRIESIVTKWPKFSWFLDYRLMFSFCMLNCEYKQRQLYYYMNERNSLIYYCCAVSYSYLSLDIWKAHLDNMTRTSCPEFETTLPTKEGVHRKRTKIWPLPNMKLSHLLLSVICVMAQNAAQWEPFIIIYIKSLTPLGLTLLFRTKINKIQKYYSMVEFKQ